MVVEQSDKEITEKSGLIQRFIPGICNYKVTAAYLYCILFALYRGCDSGR